MPTLRIANGRVFRPDGTVDRADVLLDQERGEILEVGDVPAADQTLDAAGSVVLPGLVNAHTHVAMTLFRGYADDKPLQAWLEEDIWPIEAALEPADVRVGAQLGILEMIRSGVTAFGDMYFHVPEIAAAVERAGIRAVLGHTAITLGKDQSAAEADLEDSLDIANEFHGAANGRIQTAIQPHSLTTVDEAGLRRLADAARTSGRPLHLHANETPSEVEPIVSTHDARPLVYAQECGLLQSGTLLAHCVHLTDREIEILADHDVSVLHCPAANMKLASGLAPVQRLLDAGVNVALGTDGPASNNDLDVFGELRDAAMVGKIAADDASALDAPTVVRMATAAGADALGIDGGRIEPGRVADLAVVDFDAPHLTPVHDAVSHLAYAVRGGDVRHTVCAGRVLMRNRTVTTMDAPTIRRRASNHAAALVERAE